MTCYQYLVFYLDSPPVFKFYIVRFNVFKSESCQRDFLRDQRAECEILAKHKLVAYEHMRYLTISHNVRVGCASCTYASIMKLIVLVILFIRTVLYI